MAVVTDLPALLQRARELCEVSKLDRSIATIRSAVDHYIEHWYVNADGSPAAMNPDGAVASTLDLLALIPALVDAVETLTRERDEAADENRALRAGLTALTGRRPCLECVVYQAELARITKERDEAVSMRDAIAAAKTEPTGDQLVAAEMDAAVARTQRDAAIARAEAAERERDEARRKLNDALEVLIARADAAEAEVERLRAYVAVTGGEWCAENRRAGRGPCGSCAWCCKQANQRAEQAERALAELQDDDNTKAQRFEDAVEDNLPRYADANGDDDDEFNHLERIEAAGEELRELRREVSRLTERAEQTERERDAETRLAAERWGRDTARWITERDAAVQKLELLARWIVDYEKHLTGAIDHACGRCVPGGSLVIETFVCARHIAHDVHRARKEQP